MHRFRTFKDFEAEHNKDGRSFSDDGRWVYFSDGASAELGAGGMLCDPSPDLFQRAKDVLWFETQYLDAAVRDFDSAKSEMTAAIVRAKKAGRSAPFALTQAKQRLEELKAAVDQAKARVAEADANVNAHIPQSVRTKEREREENAQRNDELLNAIMRIEV